MEKKCKECGKEDQEYYKCNKSVCKSCLVERTNTYRNSHKEHIRETERKNLLGRRTKDPVFWLFKAAKGRAKRASIPFDITIEYVRELLNKSGGRCMVSGLPFIYERDTRFRSDPYRPSLDRIVPKLGYVRGNVRLVSFCANVALNEWGLDLFLGLAKATIDHQFVEEVRERMDIRHGRNSSIRSVISCDSFSASQSPSVQSAKSHYTAA